MLKKKKHSYDIMKKYIGKKKEKKKEEEKVRERTQQINVVRP